MCAAELRAKRAYPRVRQAPLFCTNSGTKPLPLEDPYISRYALAVTVEDAGITLCRSAAASRCRVAGAELLTG